MYSAPGFLGRNEECILRDTCHVTTLARMLEMKGSFASKEGSFLLLQSRRSVSIAEWLPNLCCIQQLAALLVSLWECLNQRATQKRKHGVGKGTTLSKLMLVAVFRV